MLQEIGEDRLARSKASNQPMFRTDIDYDNLVNRREKELSRWRALDKEQRSAYANQADFEEREKVPQLKGAEIAPAKNYSLLKREVSERIKTSNIFSLLSIDPLEFDEATLELAESIENVTEIRELYKIRKRTSGTSKNAGINADEAVRIKNCFSQGRELFLAGKQGSLMVKPLNFFYALTAYAYGIIILNNPIRYRKDMLPGSHGMAYLPATIQAQFGGDSPKGTFSDLVCAFPTQLIKRQSVEFSIDCSQSIVDLYDTRFDVSLGTLLSMIPEMADYYKLTTGRNSRCHPLDISNANDPRDFTWEFHIGDGVTQPSRTSVEESFPNFDRLERFGKTIVMVPAAKSPNIRSCIYTDLRGNLWFIENPFYPIIIPEVATHFLITSMFSNIMRYRPDEWGSVLLNEVASEISLLTRHYFSSLQRKFLLVVLRSMSRYIPYAS